jgi:hypothetical protein
MNQEKLYGDWNKLESKKIDKLVKRTSAGVIFNEMSFPLTVQHKRFYLRLIRLDSEIRNLQVRADKSRLLENKSAVRILTFCCLLRLTFSKKFDKNSLWILD